MLSDIDKARRFVDIGEEDAELTFKLGKKPTKEEVAETKEFLKNLPLEEAVEIP